MQREEHNCGNISVTDSVLSSIKRLRSRNFKGPLQFLTVLKINNQVDY